MPKNLSLTIHFIHCRDSFNKYPMIEISSNNQLDTDWVILWTGSSPNVGSNVCVNSRPGFNSNSACVSMSWL